jgi:hypothetical protein
MSWGKRTIQGTEYTFHHLEPFTIIVDGKRVRVALGAHVFSRKCKPGDGGDLLFMDGKSPRTFCQTRYGHCLHLPAVIMHEAAGYVFSNHSKYVFKGKLPGLPGPYVVAFEMRRSSSPKYDVKIQVVSAHHRQKAAIMPRCSFIDAMGAVIAATPVPWIKK